MAREKKTRREALRDIVATVAAAAGLSALEIDALLAQVKKTPDLAKLASIPASSDAVKALKVLLAPKTQAAQVFQSEFGKPPALSPSIDAKLKKPVCPAYLGSGGYCTDLSCGVVVCGGLGCSTLGALDMRPGSLVAQKEPALAEKEVALAGKQPALAGKEPALAGKVPAAQPIGAKPGSLPGAHPCESDATCGCYTKWFRTGLGDIKSQWLREVQADPYIQGLMRELGAATPEALEVELTQVLAQRRVGM